MITGSPDVDFTPVVHPVYATFEPVVSRRKVVLSVIMVPIDEDRRTRLRSQLSINRHESRPSRSRECHHSKRHGHKHGGSDCPIHVMTRRLFLSVLLRLSISRLVFQTYLR